MTFLLDTHLLIWAVANSERVPATVRLLLEDRANELLFSPLSVLEVGIKFALGRPSFQIDPRIFRRELFEFGFTELPLTSLHALEVGKLPSIHKDPFDRLLIAQALAEGITLLTVDVVVAQYPAPVRKV